MAAFNVLTPYGAGLLQTYLSSLTLYLAAGSGISGGVLTEFTDTAYARQRLIWTPNGSISSNSAGITFGPAGPSGWGVGALGLFNAANGGSALMLGATDTQIVVPGGQPFTLNAGTLIFTFTPPS